MKNEIKMQEGDTRVCKFSKAGKPEYEVQERRFNAWYCMSKTWDYRQALRSAKEKAALNSAKFLGYLK